VFDNLTMPADWQATGGTVAGAQAVLDSEVGRLRDQHADLHVSGGVLVGPRDEELARIAEPGTLLVLGTQERVGPRFRFRFSLAIRLAARARGPVAVVPIDAQSTADGPVVVGLDGSEGSIAAAILAADEAAARGVSLVAVHAWWESADWEAALPFDADTLETLDNAHRRILEESLEPVVRAHPNLRIERRLVHGPRTEVLLAAAEGASELVVGKHARTATRAFLLGQVSRNILLDLWVPAIIAGLPGHDATQGQGWCADGLADVS
jgi:nucleotide-binding universal stress UspA family protein